MTTIIIPKKEAFRYPDTLGWVIHSLDGKVPKIAKWNEVITIDNCKKLFKPNTNIGLLTGKASGVVVVDFDVLKKTDNTSKYADGVIEMNKYFKKHGEPMTVKAKSGGGGFHLYFKYDKRTKQLLGGSNRAGKTQTGQLLKIDVLSDTVENKSQNIVLPPSIHPTTGLAYKWIRDPFTYDLLEMPEWLFALLEKKASKPASEQPRCVDYTKEAVEKRVRLLSDDKRASGGYSDWIKVGMTIKSCAIMIKDEEWGFELWDEWSQDGDNYNKSIMSAKWDSFTTTHPDWGYGTLCNMAKDDNPEEYADLLIKPRVKLTKTIQKHLFENEIGHSYIIRETYKNEIVGTDPNGGGYAWNNDTKLWEIYKESQLVYKVTETLARVCVDYLAFINDSKDLSDGDKKDKNRSVCNILGKVRNIKHNVNVCKYLRTSLFKSNFYEQLDNSPTLLPIKGGKVVNLQTGEIRQRSRSDMFTFECNVDMGNGDHIEDVEEFMMDLMGTEEKTRYLQTISGFFLTGKLVVELFLFCGVPEAMLNLSIWKLWKRYLAIITPLLQKRFSSSLEVWKEAQERTLLI